MEKEDLWKKLGVSVNLNHKILNNLYDQNRFEVFIFFVWKRCVLRVNSDGDASFFYSLDQTTNCEHSKQRIYLALEIETLSAEFWSLCFFFVEALLVDWLTEGAMHICNWKCELIATRSGNKHIGRKSRKSLLWWQQKERSRMRWSAEQWGGSYWTRESGCCACHACIQDWHVRSDNSASIQCSISDRLIDNDVIMASVKQ